MYCMCGKPKLNLCTKSDLVLFSECKYHELVVAPQSIYSAIPIYTDVSPNLKLNQCTEPDLMRMVQATIRFSVTCSFTGRTQFCLLLNMLQVLSNQSLCLKKRLVSKFLILFLLQMRIFFGN